MIISRCWSSHRRQISPPNATNGFPWLAKIIGPNFVNQPAGATFTLVGGDVPNFSVHFDHQLRHYGSVFCDAANSQPVHPVFNKFDEDDFVGRNLSATGFFAFVWDETRPQATAITTCEKSCLTALTSFSYACSRRSAMPTIPQHWETWDSPVVTIDRP